MRSKSVPLALVFGMIASFNMPVLSQSSKPAKLSAVDKRLQHSIKQTRYLRIYGDGQMWKNATKISGIRIDQGIEVRDPKMIKALLQKFRCTDQPANWDTDYKGSGYIHVDFMGANRPFLDNINYVNRGKINSYSDSRAEGGAVTIAPSYSLRFEAYVRGLAKRLHAHGSGVTAYNIDAI